MKRIGRGEAVDTEIKSLYMKRSERTDGRRKGYFVLMQCEVVSRVAQSV